MTVPEPMVQAILALCHHNEGYFHHECEACQFRAAAGIEHMKRIVAQYMESIGEAS